MKDNNLFLRDEFCLNAHFLNFVIFVFVSKSPPGGPAPKELSVAVISSPPKCVNVDAEADYQRALRQIEASRRQHEPTLGDREHRKEVCFDFQKGRCFRGRNCKFRHEGVTSAFAKPAWGGTDFKII